MDKFVNGGFLCSTILALFLLGAQGVAWAEEGGSAADNLNPTALLSRCYSNITNQHLPFNHPLRAQVKNGLSPIDACLTIFDKATLNASGANIGRTVAPIDAEAQSVLQTFNDLHRTWFSNDKIGGILFDPEFLPNATLMHDLGEPGLHFTRALFTPSVPASEVVTGDSVIEALRSNGPQRNESLSIPFHGATAPYTTPAAFNILAITPIAMELVQTGQLQGVRQVKLNPNKINAKGFYGYLNPYLNQPIYTQRSLGGGILGTPSYLLMNMGPVNGSDGGVTMPRRWAKTVLKDLLCRDIPVIRLSDAAPFVEPKPVAGTPSFRTGQSCMSCHASIDPASGVIRNLTQVLIPYDETNSATSVQINSPQIHQYPVTQPASLALTNSDPYFPQRPPTGSFYFRNYAGNLVNEPVMGIAGLGKVLSEQEDLYICAASRYFQYFTGIRVSMQDPGDPTSIPMTGDQQSYYNQVVQWGIELKKTQNLRGLIKNILQSNVYQKVGLGSLMPGGR